MSQEQTHYILAYYHLTPISHPHEEVNLHKKFFLERDVTCRIYLSEQGINGQMSAIKADAEAYMNWMQKHPLFQNVKFKIHPYHENVFPRITVKYRKQLVALDADWKPSERGEHVSPEKWQDMLDSQENKILLDVRNEYEWKVGHFEGAELPACETFREFTAYADSLKEKINSKKTPVMMYCTGGIRCELYSAILKERGFEKVYQLDGGVIGYGLEQGNKHWLGKLFVFDDRMAVPISEKEPASPVIGKCHFCAIDNEQYYNCANIDCNNLFLCCPDCLKAFTGCCCLECQQGPRLRPFHEQTAHKPFRRWHHYET
ncbi:MAG: rhodanese-related sulfurtransferase [Parachlamydiaceae bacterium]|nr:rhodanese-related sulfurtransferase [Parachlamydiaceae bacterium]